MLWLYTQFTGQMFDTAKACTDNGIDSELALLNCEWSTYTPSPFVGSS